MKKIIENNRIKGAFGEQTATQYLRDLGYEILAQNYRVSRFGELDIVAMDGDILCFVEVKSRFSSNAGSPSDSVNYYKIKNIKRLATIYTHSSIQENNPIRFDVIEVFLKKIQGQLAVASLNHIQNAF